MLPIALTKDNFKKEINESSVPVLIDFYAPWCTPCAAMTPIIKEVANDAKGFKVATVNIDEEPTIAEKFGVMSIPTLMVIKTARKPAVK